MDYLIHEIASIAGVSTRTLRYYDKIDLLKPSYIDTSGYRRYTSKEIDRLQEILILRQLNIPLKAISSQLSASKKERLVLLHKQKLLIEASIARKQTLLQTIDLTIDQYKGGTTMKNDEKFNGLKESIIQENEDNYGDEVRRKYGDETLNSSNQQIRKMSKWALKEAERLAQEILRLLGEEIVHNNPHSDTMQYVCSLHQQWIQFYWPEYDEKSHMGLVTMYTEDDRFKAYYDAVGEGATTLLYNAMKYYLKKDN